MADSSRKASLARDEAALDDHLRVVYRTALDALALVDDDRRYILMNEAGARALGRTVAEIVDRRIDDFTPPDKLERMEALWAELQREGALEGNYEMLRGDGRRVPIEFRATRDFRPGQHLFAARVMRAGIRGAAGAESPLTPRELEVLQLGAEGRSTREIAEMLFVSPGTVKTHLQHVYEKLGARDRAAAVAEGLRRGLIR